MSDKCLFHFEVNICKCCIFCIKNLCRLCIEEKLHDECLNKRNFYLKNNIFNYESIGKYQNKEFYPTINRVRNLNLNSEIFKRVSKKNFPTKKISFIKEFTQTQFLNSSEIQNNPRNNFNSPFIFYIQFVDPMKLHMKNLYTSEIKVIEFYYNIFEIDAEQFKTEIFICGGFLGKNYLNSCYSFNFVLQSNSKAQKRSNILYERCLNSLVSSKLNLYVIEGYNGSQMKNCEKFVEFEDKWLNIANLNMPDYYITSTFIFPSFLYTFGGYSNSMIELLNVDNLSHKWKIIHINGNTQRYYGNVFQISQDVLFFGGWKAPQAFAIFSLLNNQLKISNTFFNNYSFVSSKIRLYKNHIHCISWYNNLYLEIDLSNLNINEKEIDF